MNKNCGNQIRILIRNIQNRCPIRVKPLDVYRWRFRPRFYRECSVCSTIARCLCHLFYFCFCLLIQYYNIFIIFIIIYYIIIADVFVALCFSCSGGFFCFVLLCAITTRATKSVSSLPRKYTSYHFPKVFFVAVVVKFLRFFRCYSRQIMK